MRIRLFETKTAAVNYVKEKTGWGTAKATRHINQNLFRTEQNGYRVWINVEGID